MSAASTPTPGDALLRVTDVVKVFHGRRGRRAVRAVDGVTFTIDAGETLGIVGESGSGKSTVARIVVRLERETSGTVEFEGHRLSGLRGRQLRPFRRHIQMVFQDPYASLNPRMSVERIISEPLRNFAGPSTAREISARVRDALSACGLHPRLAQRYPHELSGGQRQRVGIARALILDPKLLVLDEPVSSLDVSVQAQILNLLTELRQELGLTYLFIGHDLSVVRHVSSRVAVMYRGRIVEVGDADSVMTNPQHPYTQLLLTSIPREIGAIPAVVEPGAAEIEQLHPDAVGCPFHPRCPAAEFPLCAEQAPALEEKGSAGRAAACHLVPSASPELAGRAAVGADERR